MFKNNVDVDGSCDPSLELILIIASAAVAGAGLMTFTIYMRYRAHRASKSDITVNPQQASGAAGGPVYSGL